MALEAGQTILHYRLVAPVGEGGMGTVWRATDTTLDREVALKFLPDAMAQDPERVARFEREAKLLASFNHPHIAAIHGLHEANGQRLLAMELVPGEDLAARLERGPLPLAEALPLLLQVAGALELAHDHGVVHRDLKPANICVTPDAQAKVLDFGLAKAVEATPAGNDPSLSPTVTSARTLAGTVMGTAAYMSPEQARGHMVDRRADIWAFGAVAYEMLTGRRAFPGDTISDTMVSVLSSEPDYGALPTRTPPALLRLLQRCLEKEHRRRLRDIGEARVLLEDLVAGREVDAPATAASPTAAGPPRSALLWLLPTVLVGLALAAWVGTQLAPQRLPTIDPDVGLRRVSYTNGLAQDPSISPDGNYVAYTTDEGGNQDIALQPLDGGSPRLVVDHPADDGHPAWSPDGSRLAFVSARNHSGRLSAIGGLGFLSRLVDGAGGDIFLAPALGGPATRVVSDGCYPAWSPDGSQLAFMSARAGDWGIWTVPVTGGEPTVVADGPGLEYQPTWSPDGEWIVYASGVPHGLFACRIGGGEPVALYGGRAMAPALSPDGQWVYFSSDRASAPGRPDLWRIPFRPGEGAIDDPQRVTLGELSELSPVLSSGGERLAYGQRNDAPDIWSWDAGTGEIAVVAEYEGSEDVPHLHPNGRHLLFSSARGGGERTWRLDLQTGALEQLAGTGETFSPRWSPDGSRLLYGDDVNNAGPGVRLMVRSWGDVQATVVLDSVPGLTGPSWSPDGRSIVVGSNGVLVVPPDGPARRVVDDENVAFPTWSPDGREIAFQRERPGGGREIWKVPAAGGEPTLVAGGDVEYSHPQWNPVDPEQILVVVDHQDLAIITVSTGEVERVTDLASSAVLIDYPSWTFDGQRALFSLARAEGDIYLLEGL